MAERLDQRTPMNQLGAVGSEEAYNLERLAKTQSFVFFSGLLDTSTTTSGIVLNVQRSDVTTIMLELTGMATANSPEINIYGRVRGLPWVTILDETAQANTSFAFIIGEETGDMSRVTGLQAGFTGCYRWDELFMDVIVSAEVTGGAITVRARALTSS
jgi:hypothetical protein